jgi:uncharacterized protein YjgD (DUF1641 family)
MDFNDCITVTLDDVMNLLNVALNRVHSTNGFTYEQSFKLIDALGKAKEAVATATEYTPKNF